MHPLVIKLNGAIEETNFDEWKNELISEIKSVNTSLTTDTEFANATKQVKQFKAAEKSLKAAKQSALEQASEINRLFEAIDEVSEETRQVRLTLDRQIKKRKEEIKEEHIAAGVETIKAVIESQSPDFKLIDHTQYLDEDHFVEAVKGRSSAKTMQASVDKTCKEIATAISARAELISSHVASLDSLPADQQSLFQDRANLLAMSKEQLNNVIDERVDKWEALKQSATDPSPSTESDTLADPHGDKDPETTDDTSAPMTSGSSDPESNAENDQTTAFVLTLQMEASRLVAESIRDEIEKVWKDDSAVKSITLSS